MVMQYSQSACNNGGDNNETRDTCDDYFATMFWLWWHLRRDF